jgi:crossover junction endodeoxyribonuclease RusA
MASFNVVLPLPPSTNNLYENVGKRRVTSGKYASWMRDAILTVFAQVTADRRIGGTVEVLIQIAPETPGDIDNRIKAVLDCLVKSQRVDDDRHVWRVTIERYRLIDPDKALVTVAATDMIGTMLRGPS